MLEKLATHEVESVTTLFSLADKCARAAEDRAWHSAPQDRVAQVGGSRATAQGGGKKKKNKNRGRERPQAGAMVTATVAGGPNTRGKRPRTQGGDSGSCPVHPTACHSAADCREIQKPQKQLVERQNFIRE